MIISYTGDSFLSRRAARAALGKLGFGPGAVTELGEGMSAQSVSELASQGGLFGQTALLLDFEAAFHGVAGVKPRNEVMKVLEEAGGNATIVVLDPDATPARQKALQQLGKHHHQALPRRERLGDWVAAELKDAGVDFEREVPSYLAELFGEDAAGIVSEIQKLASLDERIGLERAKAVVNRAATHNAFDIIERIAAGDITGAVTVTRRLIDSGEAVPRVFGALTWQFMLVAKAAGLRRREGGKRISGGQAASILGAAPYAADKALTLAARLDEASVKGALRELLAADVAAKTGRDQDLALEAAVIGLARRWSSAARGAG
ncbi:MAG TPA: DNA polymerase III subunit delta [Trueperaceae bacterium]|nr:DNA polymerase III subunit delta [Trueperaceae bacterium]